MTSNAVSRDQIGHEQEIEQDLCKADDFKRGVAAQIAARPVSPRNAMVGAFGRCEQQIKSTNVFQKSARGEVIRRRIVDNRIREIEFVCVGREIPHV